jgi:rSAM/selenodomain-associated transferase 2
MLSIVVPTLDEAATLQETLAPLQAVRGPALEILVVDGGSRDATRTLAASLADRVIESPRGRATQMNAGARSARGDTLLFLHADTRLDASDATRLEGRLAASGREWGRFDVAIDGGGALLSVVAAFMNARSRLTGIATGDQAIFVRRGAFESAGGFPAIALMEDVALSKVLRRRSPPLCLRERVSTSPRRWQRRGVLRTIVLMWRLRLAYALGADPARLARRYDVERTST